VADSAVSRWSGRAQISNPHLRQGLVIVSEARDASGLVGGISPAAPGVTSDEVKEHRAAEFGIMQVNVTGLSKENPAGLA
jgi:hypothetical protein